MIKDYFKSLNAFRLKAAQDFFSAQKNYREIIDLMEEFLSRSFNQFEGPDFPEVENGNYIYMLIASYIRTHHIINEHIIQSELIEAVVLIRKQFELLSRLNELKTEDADELIQKTPNLKHVKTKINELYSMYSEIAHSASNDFYSLLGVKEVEGKALIKLYPEFNEQTEIALQHNIMCFYEFLIWMIEFKKEYISDYDPAKDEELSSELLFLSIVAGLFEEEDFVENE